MEPQFQPIVPPAANGEISPNRGLTPIRLATSPQCITPALSPGARGVIAEAALRESLGSADPELANYLGDFALRASLLRSLSVVHPMDTSFRASSCYDILLMRTQLKQTGGLDHPLFHLQFGEFALDIASSSTESDVAWAKRRGSDLLENLCDGLEILVNQEFSCAAKGRAMELPISPDVLALISFRPTEVIEAARQIRKLLLKPAA